MPTVLRFRFPAGTFHATPWGHHVNEGLVEWPPSPWRILRALLATGYTKAGWDADGPPPIARGLVTRLAASAPSYVLPTVSPGQSRHYVDAASKKPLILDAFLRVQPGESLEVVWDLELGTEERTCLADLADKLGYLGRAESWVECTVADTPACPPTCMPVSGASAPRGAGWETVDVLVPVSEAAYDDWLVAQTAPIRAEHEPAEGKKLTAAARKKLDKALAPFPVSLVDALCADTGALQDHGWSGAPGSQLLRYWRRTDALEPRPPRTRAPVPDTHQPFALLALATPSRNASALPPCTRTFPQGRLLHRALASAVGRVGADDVARVLLGQDGDGPSLGNHDHAHLLHLDLDLDGHLDHVLVWAPAGLPTLAIDALRQVRRTWQKGSKDDVQVAFAGTGPAELLRGLPMIGDVLSATLGPAAGATTWRSATPYFAPRFTKRRGKDSLEGQVKLELERRGLPSAKVEVLHLREEGLDRFRHHIAHDAHHGPRVPVPLALRLTFAARVEGPICLGYGSHAGLGRFEACAP